MQVKIHANTDADAKLNCPAFRARQEHLGQGAEDSWCGLARIKLRKQSKGSGSLPPIPPLLAQPLGPAPYLHPEPRSHAYSTTLGFLLVPDEEGSSADHHGQGGSCQ